MFVLPMSSVSGGTENIGTNILCLIPAKRITHAEVLSLLGKGLGCTLA